MIKDEIALYLLVLRCYHGPLLDLATLSLQVEIVDVL